jgi:hypothetical protein
MLMSVFLAEGASGRGRCKKARSCTIGIKVPPISSKGAARVLAATFRFSSLPGLPMRLLDCISHARCFGDVRWRDFRKR